MKTPAKKLTMNDVADLVQRIAQLTVQEDTFKARCATALVRTKDLFKLKAKPVAEERVGLMKLLRSWGRTVKDQIFSEKRSIEFTHGTVGFRKSPYAVEVVNGGDQDAIGLITAAGLRKRYVRVVEELDREALLRDRETRTEAEWSELGLSFTQTDDFFVDVKIAPAATPKA